MKNKIKYKYRKIIKNRDSKGYILTYTVKDEYGMIHEVNTIHEAKLWARIDPLDNPEAEARHEKLIKESEELLRKLKIPEKYR